jgi:hypothetical protein
VAEELGDILISKIIPDVFNDDFNVGISLKLPIKMFEILGSSSSIGKANGETFGKMMLPRFAGVFLF